MTKYRYVSLLAVLPFLSSCSLSILDPKGIIAASEKSLLVWATLLMLVIVVPVIVMSFLFAWKYRASANAAYSPKWSHSNLLEIICWSVPCIIIGVLATWTWISSHQLDPYRPLDSNVKPITIQAVALDWKWLFIYPEQNIASVNFVEIPVNVPVRFEITADAPMNSLEIPQLAGQIYAMTGMRTKLHLMANEIGSYQGMSTNFSGDGFSDMNFVVRADSKQAFDGWVSQVKKGNRPLTTKVYKKLAHPSQNNAPEYFSTVTQGLFDQVIMKYMGPQMKMDDNMHVTDQTS